MVRKSDTPYMGILLLILVSKAILITWFIASGPVGLGPDEAQYWTWSQDLDWGYYSKPPGIAWQIWLGTLVFGNTELGVRCASVLLGLLLPLIVYLLARRAELKVQTSFWAALTMALTPLGIFSSMLAITDVGMVFFWTCACTLIVSALAKQKTPNYYLFGFFIMVGALFKWPIYLLWCLVVGLFAAYPFLRSRHCIGGMLLSLVGLAPSFTWNMQHDWVTLRHVLQSIQGSEPSQLVSKGIFSGNFLQFLGAQAALVSPILFILLLIALGSIFAKRKEITPPLAFCGLSTLFLLGLLGTLSLFKKVQGNWVDYAYPTGIVFMSWYCFEAVDWGRRWIQAGIALSVALVAFALSIPYIQSHSASSELEIPYRINPFRHMLGWENLRSELENAGYDPENHFLFSNKYQMSSIISFYGPEQKRAYFLNLFGIRKNQFSFWPGMSEEQLGKDGFYVIAENEPHLSKHFEDVGDYIKTLTPYFSNVEFMGVKPLFTSYGKTAKGALIFKCREYNGRIPEEADKY